MLFKERSTKEAGTMPPFVERLEKIHENIKTIFLELLVLVLNLIKKSILHFLIVKLVYLQGAL